MRPASFEDQEQNSELNQISLSLMDKALQAYRAMGALASGSTSAYTEESIRSTFDAYFSYTSGDFKPEKLHETREYKDLVKLLLFLGILRPNVAEDWEVDRDDGVDTCLGVNIAQMEFLIAEKYPFAPDDPDPRFRTLEKGIGSGVSQRRRAINNSRKSDDLFFEQFGIADRLYFPIERIIQRFIRKTFRKNPHYDSFIRLFCLAMRKKLKSCWYEADNNVVSAWKPKSFSFDLNIIYPLLEDPRPWLEEWYSPETGEYLASPRFENEARAQLSLSDHYLFLSMSGYSYDEIMRILTPRFKEEGPTYAYFQVVDRIEKWKEKSSERKRTFKDSFFYNPEEGRTISGDLNECPLVHLDNVAIDTFDRTGKYFAPTSISEIIEQRSTSHLGIEEYIEDFKRNLGLLKPGGYLLSDGIRASYNEIFRGIEVLAALDGDDNFKAEVIVHNDSLAPVALFIQKRHPNGFFTDEDKARFLVHETKDKKAPSSPKYKFVPLDAVVQRPDVLIMDQIRRQIKLCSRGRGDMIFKGIQDQIEGRVAVLLAEHMYCMKDMVASRPDPRDVLSLVKSGLLPISEHLAALSINAVVREINKAVRSTRIVGKSRNGKDPNSIYTFTNYSTDTSTKVNMSRAFPSAELPQNSELATRRMRDFLRSSEHSLKCEILRLKKDGLKEPVALLSFTDCVTNDLLEKELEDLLGDKILTIPVDFQPVSGRNSSDVSNRTDIVIKLMRFIADGGILIGGGSWQDSYSEVPWREVVAKKLLREVMKPDTRLRMLEICFSAQVFADTLGKEHFNGALRTVPGMFEIGPTPIRILPEAKSHPIFEEFPDFVTAATTHSGHILNKARSRRYQMGLSPDLQFRPMAESHITGLPLVWSACNDRVISTIIHPEIELTHGGGISPKVMEVQKQLECASGLLEKRFRIGPEQIMNNWHQVLDSRGNSRLRTDAGRLMLVRSLLHLAKTL